jgi:hypothetical protein
MISLDGEGNVHIGPTSFVFTDSEANGGIDKMSSSVGKIQIGNSATDTTTIVGSLNVQDPTQDSHAASRGYVDKLSTMAAVLDTRLPVNGKKNRVSLNTAKIHSQSAIGLSLVGIFEKDEGETLFDYSLGVANSGSETMSKGSIGFSF